MKLPVAGILLLCTVFAAPAAAQNPMRDGQWETTVQMSMANMPMQMPPMKGTRCVTAEEVKDPNRSLPTGPDQPSCKVSDYKAEGNKVTWKVACSNPQKMTGSGELVFTDDTYTGTAKMSMDMGEMTMKYTGKRLGDCKK